MAKTKRRQIRHDHLSNMRKRSKAEGNDDPPSPISAQSSFSESESQSSLAESESDSTDSSAFKPDKEALVRTMFDFYDTLIEAKNHNGNVSCGTKVRVVCNGKIVDRRGHLKSDWQESLIKSKTCANDQVGDQEATLLEQTPKCKTLNKRNRNEDVCNGPKVRVLCNGKVISQRRHLKKNWSRSRKSRVYGNKSLNETVLSGTLPRGRNGGIRPAVHVPVLSRRQINRVMNMDRVNSKRQQTRDRQRLKREQIAKAQKVLETALGKSSLSQRVAHVYDVQQGERMVCLAGNRVNETIY